MAWCSVNQNYSLVYAMKHANRPTPHIMVSPIVNQLLFVCVIVTD